MKGIELLLALLLAILMQLVVWMKHKERSVEYEPKYILTHERISRF